MGVSGLEFATFDVFTTTVFRGNPLAIVQVPHGRTVSQEEKQTIAREFNYSETVFLHIPASDSGLHEWRIDIFTLDQELPFAGHPTIGTAWALGQTYPGLQHGSLLTKAGAIPITIERSGQGDCRATASIPHKVHIHSKKLSVEKLGKLQPALVAQGQLQPGFDVVSIVKGMTFALIKLDSIEALEKVELAPTATSLYVELDQEWSPSWVATYFYVIHGDLLASERVSISCRMIEAGVGEDPATGSAGSALAAYLAMERLHGNPQASKSVEFALRQGVQMGRDSLIHIRVVCNDSNEIDQIFLSGSAVQVMSGRLV